jgi:hypothetical protein
VVIDDFNVVHISAPEGEANSELIVNPDAVLSLSISGKSLETISRRDSQINQMNCPMQNAELL